VGIRPDEVALLMSFNNAHGLPLPFANVKM
jgi:hypothetical protein